MLQACSIPMFNIFRHGPLSLSVHARGGVFLGMLWLALMLFDRLWSTLFYLKTEK
jgi:hypothetical protein